VEVKSNHREYGIRRKNFCKAKVKIKAKQRPQCCSSSPTLGESKVLVSVGKRDRKRRSDSKKKPNLGGEAEKSTEVER